MLVELVILAIGHIVLTGATALVLQRWLHSFHYLANALLSSFAITAILLLSLLALSDRHERPIVDLVLQTLTYRTSISAILGAFVVGSAGGVLVLRLSERMRRSRNLA